MASLSSGRAPKRHPTSAKFRSRSRKHESKKSLAVTLSLSESPLPVSPHLATLLANVASTRAGDEKGSDAAPTTKSASGWFSSASSTSSSPPPVSDVPKLLVGYRNMARSMLNPRKAYRTTFGWEGSFSTNGSGTISTTANVLTLPTVLGEFVNYAALFDEFFVESMATHYIPNSRYQYVPSVTLGTSNSNVPLVSVLLYNGVATYGTMVGACENVTYKAHSSGDPFRRTWVNPLLASECVLVNTSTSASTPAAEGWCLTSATPASTYCGQIQYISSNAVTSGAVQLGQLFYKFKVLFRLRA